MGLVHARATITPSKQELVETWLPTRSWASGATTVEKVAEYRFDDPDGEVGVETILWRTDDGTVLQVPFTYRAAPLAGAEEFLVGTADHSVLGPRWVYDGSADPVWAATLSAAILTGGTQAQMVIERDGELIDVPSRMQVRGSGSARRRDPHDHLGGLGRRRRRGHHGHRRIAHHLLARAWSVRRCPATRR